MNNDTIIAGVGAGPMTDIYDIKILVCYLLSVIDKPMSKQQITAIFQDGQYVNYFSLCEALKALLESKHISSDSNEIYTLNDLGRDTASHLKSALPTSLKERVVETAILLLAKTKLLKENEVTCTPYKNGYNVTISMHDDGFDLLNLTMLVPDNEQAELIKERFLNNPVKFYQKLTEMLIN